ncbi:ribosomal protein S9/S16-domain-containing protein [Radiomyces spectabilis]|uniref:ribosomal protein S9/S16-domain-containing protein n=1 Tax=Radiomyces spectabilis TaxID=64574 RepID=UPI00222084C4|nr:ribosomal protein S9/S16-domain-containing protein [Radiomyces spectabilis]KAI8369289.1 ribosomal protein S9/S16-domain-containing protein [Radiomyces spectabilis]
MATSAFVRRGLANLVPATTKRFHVPTVYAFSSILSNHSVRHATTQASTFAPNHGMDDLLTFREKPHSLSYFTGNYKYNDLLIDLDVLYKRHINHKPVEASLPSSFVPSGGADATSTTYAWKLRDKMSEMLGIPLKTSQWRKITSHLDALASLPQPLPLEVKLVLDTYVRSDTTQEKVAKVRTLDELGRAYAAGRRKESTARCWVVEGEGKILVNGQELDSYFKRPVDREEVTWPLQVTENMDKYNVWVVVNGGGSTGQAQAIKLGIGKALLIHNSELKPTLRKAGCITRDPRVVERKKEGQRKARAKYTWVKR